MKAKLKSLSGVLSVFFTVCLALIVAVVASIALFSSNRSFESSFEEESQTALKGFTGNVKTFGIKAETAASGFANNPELVDAVNGGNQYTMAELLKASIRSYGISYAFIANSRGELIASSTSDFTPSNFSKLVHVQNALQQKSSLTNEVVTGKDLCICSGAPLMDKGKLIGVVSVMRSYLDTDLLDQLKGYTGCEFTVFNGDERVSTTVTKDSKRQIGTKMSEEVAGTVLKGNREYIGKTSILGVSHMADYVPIKGPDGKAVGALFAGKNISAAQQNFLTSALLCVGITILLILAAVIVLRIFITKQVKKPLMEVVTLANHMERGEIGITDPGAVAITVDSENEVGQVAAALLNTVHSLRMYVGEIRDVLSAISAGDLTVSAKGDYRGDFTAIKDALNQITRSLNGVFVDIDSAAESVSTRAEEISNGAMAMSQGATEQASATEELSATISEISEQVQKTARNAAVANKTAQESFDQVEAGNRNVEAMMKSMSEISAASTKIGKIVKTIENIAFQTNILALNAAVEAARAGSAGKGFSVVADEVRNLASKSAEAAKQTTELIGTTVALVNSGVRTANATAGSFREIRSGTRQTSELIAEISDATGRQAAAVSQITHGIDQIAGVVQTNSASAEENAAASRDLSGQAETLLAQVAKFRIQKESSAAKSVPPTKAGSGAPGQSRKGTEESGAASFAYKYG